VFFAIWLVWSAQARAENVSNPAAVIATPAQERLVRLPVTRIGGIRDGNIMTMTERGTENVTPAMFAQQQMSKPYSFSEFCNTR
jgi:hypothetical protein